jgi:hypothetical protein
MNKMNGRMRKNKIMLLMNVGGGGGAKLKGIKICWLMQLIFTKTFLVLLKGLELE